MDYNSQHAPGCRSRPEGRACAARRRAARAGNCSFLRGRRASLLSTAHARTGGARTPRLRAAVRQPPCRRGRQRSGRCCPSKVPAAGAPRQPGPARPRRSRTALLSPRRAAVGGGRGRHGAVQAQGAAPQVGVAGEAGEAAAGGAGGGAAARGGTADPALAPAPGRAGGHRALRRPHPPPGGTRGVRELGDRRLAGREGRRGGGSGAAGGAFSVPAPLAAFRCASGLAESDGQPEPGGRCWRPSPSGTRGGGG